jgi:hypothetical protein
MVPNLLLCTSETPLRKILDIFRSIHLGKLAAYFESKFTMLTERNELELNSLQDEVSWAETNFFPTSDTNRKETRCRLIGEHIKKISPHMAELVACIRPPADSGTLCWPDGKLESEQEFKNRVGCHAYVHLLRCLSSVLSSWVMTINCDEHGAEFLGNLFVLVVRHFALHRSYNTFCFAQIAPFKIKSNRFKYQISPTKSLNIGLYGKNESGEHRQKLVKEHYLKWTNKKKKNVLLVF